KLANRRSPQALKRKTAPPCLRVEPLSFFSGGSLYLLSVDQSGPDLVFILCITESTPPAPISPKPRAVCSKLATTGRPATKFSDVDTRAPPAVVRAWRNSPIKIAGII